MIDIEGMFKGYADVCSEVQRRAVAMENHPDRQKRLRHFPLREVAEYLSLSQSHLRTLLRENADFPRGASGDTGRKNFLAEEIHEAREWLWKSTGNTRYRRHRDPSLGEKLQVVSFVNFKGGSGKTTSSTHFAQYLALHGYRVLLVDLDPQASATALFGIHPDTEVAEDETFAGWVRRSETRPDAEGVERDRAPGEVARGMVRKTYWPGLSLVPASIALQNAEFELISRIRSENAFFRELSGFLNEISDDYDIVVCDCRPDVGVLTINSLVAATGLVVPIPPQMIDFASSGEFFRFMSEIARDFRRNVSRDMMNYDFVRILTTKYKPADRSQTAIVNWERALFSDAVLEHPMVDTAMMDSAGILKETLYEFEPTGNRRTYERALEAMNLVNGAIEAELLQVWGRTKVRQGALEVA